MEALQSLSNRQLHLDTLFSTNVDSRENTDINSALTVFGNVLEKQAKTWWGICTFEHYLKEKIIMQSLRWDVSPQGGLDNSDSQSEWLEFFYRVGIRLQELVLKRKIFKMNILEQKIDKLQIKLDPLKSTPQLIEFNKERNLKEVREGRSWHTKKKLKKFHCDKGDFKNNLVYEWQYANQNMENMDVQKPQVVLL